jgi:hypothetical protein
MRSSTRRPSDRERAWSTEKREAGAGGTRLIEPGASDRGIRDQREYVVRAVAERGVQPMREVVAHLIITLDGVVKFETVHEAVLRMSNGRVEKDMHRKLAQEDAMLLGRTAYDA